MKEGAKYDRSSLEKLCLRYGRATSEGKDPMERICQAGEVDVGASLER